MRTLFRFGIVILVGALIGAALFGWARRNSFDEIGRANETLDRHIMEEMRPERNRPDDDNLKRLPK